MKLHVAYDHFDEDTSLWVPARAAIEVEHPPYDDADLHALERQIADSYPIDPELVIISGWLSFATPTEADAQSGAVTDWLGEGE